MSEALKKKYLDLLKEYGLTEIEKQFLEGRESILNLTQKSWKEDLDVLNRLTDIAREMAPSYSEISYFQWLYESLGWVPLQKPVYCGPFLAPVVNAGIREYDEGYLILSNVYLLIAVIQATLSVILSSPSWTFQGKRVNPVLTIEEAARHLKETVGALIGFRSDFELLDPTLCSELQWASLVSYSAMGFVITHEYSHALLRHKTNGENDKRIEQEWEADAKAIELYTTHLKHDELRTNALEMGAWLVGPPLFLLVGAIFEKNESWISKTHPPSSKRLIEAKNKIESKLKHTEAYRVSWNFLSHFVQIASIAGLISLGDLYTNEADW